MKKLNKTGAGATEYGFITALIAIVTIFGITVLGEWLREYFTQTQSSIEVAHGGSGSSGGPPEPVDPFAAYRPIFDESGNWLIGTGASELLDGYYDSYDGIIGLDGDDTLRIGTAGGIFIGAKGNDNIEAGNGAAVVIFAKGDGSDFLDLTYHSNRLIFPDLSLAESTFHVGPSGDLVISFGGGDQLFIDQAFYSSGKGFKWIDFSDSSLTYDGSLALAHEHDKSTGLVTGTRQRDIHTHTASVDGSYRIAGASTNTDRITFTETNFADASFTRPNASDVVVNVSGDEVIFDFYLGSSGVLEYVTFADGAVTRQAILDRSIEGSKATGTVYLSASADNLTHYNGDGSYTVTGNSGGVDTADFADQSFAGASFAYADGTNSVVITTQAGDIVTITNYFSDSALIETVKFQGVTYSSADIQARI